MDSLNNVSDGLPPVSDATENPTRVFGGEERDGNKPERKKEADASGQSFKDLLMQEKKVNFRFVDSTSNTDGVDVMLTCESASADEESFVKQRAKVTWLAEGDANTKYFHNVLKCKNNRKMIHSVMSSDGRDLVGDLMINEFVTFYRSFLGGDHDQPIFPSTELFSTRLDSNIAADDLFIFSRGDASSASCILEVLKRFADLSGLFPSNQKSTVYFCHVPPHVKNGILSILPFEEGKFPVKYLGVPLISSRLNSNHCRELINRLENRITCWNNKFLSFAGRLQLTRSVLSSMHIFWATAFMLPASTAKEIESILKRFLWGAKEDKKCTFKVSWKKIL
ncbi:hypothetical protein QVD17_00066 [Tagetes erecta]|uniref:Reverse transcriptase n=1 Tax=Tagetes erecta TaxID=13708 RepID=A0AAD8P5I4_TARER|nr:hypothetical protein QVD17_00066 [Tagetes erecta]